MPDGNVLSFGKIVGLSTQQKRVKNILTCLSLTAVKTTTILHLCVISLQKV
jgi:hypothetical protein